MHVLSVSVNIIIQYQKQKLSRNTESYCNDYADKYTPKCLRYLSTRAESARADYSGRTRLRQPDEEVSVYGDVVVIFIFQQID